MPIDRFQGGNDQLRNKLNQLVDAVNALMNIRGAEPFISVNRGPSGVVIGLNINQVLPRIPKPILPDFRMVLVKQVAGSAGSRTTACTFTYNLYEITDTSLITAINASPLSPDFPGPRVMLAKIKKAPDGSVGMAYYDLSGTIKLYLCRESFDGQNNC